ncbi:MAG: hypothetical protein RIF32_11655 [Leptospirales bacterium]|jgi:hypothetical protein
MKFLITGSLRSARGPRTLITLSLALFILFIAAHAIRESGSTGLTFESVQANLYGGPHEDLSLFEPPPGFIAILEDLHMDLFFFGLLGLFLGSILYQVRLDERAKQFLLYAIFLLPLAYIFSRGLSYFFAGAAFLVLPAAVASYFVLLLTMGLILRDLYRTAPGD